MGPWILFFSFSAQVPISSMAMNTSVCTQRHIHIVRDQFSSGAATGEFTESFILQAVTPGANMTTNPRLQIVWASLTDETRICRLFYREKHLLQCVLGETHVCNDGAVALNDVRAVVTLQHNIQVHEDPLVLILVSCATHLLVTQNKQTNIKKKHSIQFKLNFC